MVELIEKGYLYIAQPPLYKVKRGNHELYLKDEQAFEDYILEQGTSDIALRSLPDNRSGTWASKNSRPWRHWLSSRSEEIHGAELITFLKSLIAYEHLLKRFEYRRMDVLAFRAVTLGPAPEADDLRDPDKVDRLVEAATAVFKRLYPGEPTPETHATRDEEHEAYRVLFERAKEGTHSRLVLDIPMVTSAEYRELRARGQAMKRLGLPPYGLKVRGSCANAHRWYSSSIR